MVIDTSIFIEYLRAKDKTNTTLHKIAGNDDELYISAVTLYELHMGATTEEKRLDIDRLTNSLFILPFTGTIAITAAQIYHRLRLSNKMIEFRDIFIAATCIVHHLPVITLNKKHFERIEELQIVNSI